MSSVRNWLPVALSMLACAAPQPPPPLPPRPAERSSIDVLLRHRGELGLTEEQVTRLELLDEQREKDVAALRLRVRELRTAHGKTGKDVASGVVSPRGQSMGGARGGMGGMGSMGGGGMGRHGAQGGGGARHPAEHDELERLRLRMDDADTRSFIDAQSEVLTEGQRPAAEKLASAYRAALYDFRAAVRRGRGDVEE